MKKIIERAFALGRAYFDEVEIYIEATSSQSITTYNDTVENFRMSETGGMNIRGLKDGRTGSAYTEEVSLEAVDALVENAIAAHRYIDTEDISYFHDGSGEYLPERSPEPDDAPAPDEIIGRLLAIFEETRANCDALYSMSGHFGKSEYHIVLANTKNLYKEASGRSMYAYFAPIITDGDEKIQAYYLTSGKTYKELKMEDAAKEALRRALIQCGAHSVPGGKTYPILMHHECVEDFVATLLDMMDAESVQKGLSPLAGKLGEEIFATGMTLIDDPVHPDAFSDISFDGEGYPTKKQTLIENGVLKTYLHNLKTAAKDGVESTGNASRASYKSSIYTQAWHVAMTGGTRTKDEILQGFDGLYITEVEAFHAGMNATSGDFSLPASGFLIEDGKISHPVDQITISGNLLKMFRDIGEISSDVEPSDGRSLFMPSIVFTSLSVGGK